MDKYFGDNRIKQLIPGIIRKDELKKMPEPKSELKNQELFYRSLNK